MNQKFVFKVVGVNKSDSQEFLTQKQIDKLKFSDWKQLSFSIEDLKTRKKAAFITFNLAGDNKRVFQPDIIGSREDSVLATNFFRTFRQSPFRLLLFSSLTFIEKNGFHNFLSGEGLDDNGVAHKRQLRQRIFSHVKTKNGYNEFLHKLGEFPRVSFSEIEKILAANKTVPARLLPPESVLRKVRAKSFAHLNLIKLGKEKYKAKRKLKLSRK